MLAENIKRTYIFGISPSSGGKLFAKDEFGRMHSLNQFKVDGIMNTQADKLIMHIEQIIREFTAKRFCEQGSPVYITGAGFLIKGMESYISQKLGKRCFLLKNMRKCGFLQYTAPRLHCLTTDLIGVMILMWTKIKPLRPIKKEFLNYSDRFRRKICQKLNLILTATLLK